MASVIRQLALKASSERGVSCRADHHECFRYQQLSPGVDRKTVVTSLIAWPLLPQREPSIGRSDHVSRKCEPSQDLVDGILPLIPE